MRLPDPTRSQVLLIGVSAYQSAELPDLPAVRNNLDDLAAALTDSTFGGFADATVLADPSSVRSTYRAIRDHADRAEHTLLAYFAGHGLTGPRRGELFLALADTELGELTVSALNFNLIREIFLDCPAKNRVLILDCCFSGRATADFMAGHTLPGEVDIAGTYIIASAPPNARALAPPGATHTAFTGELLSFLTNGIPDGPELLTLGDTYRHLRRTMIAKGLPEPGRRTTDSADLLALSRNPAYQVTQPEITPPPAPRPKPVPSAAPPKLPLHLNIPFVFVGVVFIALMVWLIFIPDSQSHNPASQTPTTTTTQSGPPSDPRKVPITVYNGGTIKGLASQAAIDFQADGWTARSEGNVQNGGVDTTTVYYRSGTDEQAAAEVLAARFSMRPAENNTKTGIGLIVIVTNDYQGGKP